ncbi:MAG: hypothetical protein B6I20_03725 [Bacteroidetes bacterium 4572_117]|nr:MAG: hypothetical protein B6I20_03725 [Bacteroidetes bacterium 4572_117]
MGEKTLINEFIKDRNVGAITSTSGYITKKLLSKIDFDNAKVIVEYGSGKGVITKQLLSQMREDTTLFVFETNEQFIKDLSKINDKRLIIINSDAEKAQITLKNEHKTIEVDYIISTIPFTFMDRRKRKRTIFRAYALLKAEGKFITYQYSWIIYHLIKSRFYASSIKIRLFNIPPVFIIVGTK